MYPALARKTASARQNGKSRIDRRLVSRFPVSPYFPIRTVQRKPTCACGGSCPRCKEERAGQTRLPLSRHTNGKFYSGKSSCSPDWFGDTSPEIDSTTGKFTGKLIVKYNDRALKDSCVRDCVKEHEQVHVRQLTPIVKKVHACDMAAGNDPEKSGQCNLMWNQTVNKPGQLQTWECEAYRKSFTCLTLKILDAKSPCSKSPHREEIQKHRKYEACEMKRHCKEAGTPELGVPLA